MLFRSKENPHSLALATAGAVMAGVLVLIAGAIAHRPLSTVPENTMKFAVGLLLTTFGTYWSVEGLGYFAEIVSKSSCRSIPPINRQRTRSYKRLEGAA